MNSGWFSASSPEVEGCVLFSFSTCSGLDLCPGDDRICCPSFRDLSFCAMKRQMWAEICAFVAVMATPLPKACSTRETVPTSCPVPNLCHEHQERSWRKPVNRCGFFFVVILMGPIHSHSSTIGHSNLLRILAKIF